MLLKLKNHFWTRFTKEYLTELGERHATSRTGKAVRQPKVGDIVLMKDGGPQSMLPRSRWHLARVSLVHPGRDGSVRSVDVMLTVSKGDKPCVMRHKSPRQLVPLECDEEED